jgi:hypothetical protein
MDPYLEGELWTNFHTQFAVDLQKTSTAVFDAGNMEYLINYTQEPDVPLSADVASWADAILRAAGKRP